MQYVDYRKMLGVGFDAEKNFTMLQAKIINVFDKIANNYQTKGAFLGEKNVFYYCQEVGEFSFYHDYRDIRNSLLNENGIRGLICKAVVLANIIYTQNSEQFFIDYIKRFLDELNISYQTMTDNDGIFIFPKGAEELDAKLISEPLQWLAEYSKTKCIFIDTLKQYEERKNPRDIADNLRKTLETFLQEFFKNEKILCNNISEIGKFLDIKCVNKELKALFTSLISQYDNANNAVAKHHDRINSNMLEFVLYQTGTFIRTLIQLNQTTSE